MRKFSVAVAVALTASLLVSAPSAPAIEWGKKYYDSCKQLNKKYKNGVAVTKFHAKQAQKKGYLKAKVNAKVFFNNDYLERPEVNGVICPKTPPPPSLNPPSAVESLSVIPGLVSRYGTPSLSVCFGPPGLGNERGDATYDVFLNGELWKESEKAGTIPLQYCNAASSTISIDRLAGGTAYTVGIRARNDVGVGPILEVVGTTPSQIEFDRYGQTLISYEASGSSGYYSYTIETSSGGTSQGYTGNGVFYEAWFDDGDFVYVSLQNQNGAGSVTCMIKGNGAVRKQTTSDGAYVIATCSGRA